MVDYLEKIMKKFEQYIKDNGVEIIKCKSLKELPYGGRQYKVTLRNKARKKLTILYILPFKSMPGPLLDDIFHTLVDEAHAFEKHFGFGNWWDYITGGYVNAEQIPKVKKLYRDLVKLMKRLKKFTGDSYLDLLACK